MSICVGYYLWSRSVGIWPPTVWPCYLSKIDFKFLTLLMGVVREWNPGSVSFHTCSWHVSLRSVLLPRLWGDVMESRRWGSERMGSVHSNVSMPEVLWLVQNALSLQRASCCGSVCLFVQSEYPNNRVEDGARQCEWHAYADILQQTAEGSHALFSMLEVTTFCSHLVFFRNNYPENYLA